MYAPWEGKIRRVCESGRSHVEAAELVTNIDQERAAFIRKYFGADWPTRQLYHLMINSVVGDEAVIKTILDEVASLNSLASRNATEETRSLVA